MVNEQRAICPANEALVEHMRKWWTNMAQNKPKNYTHNTEKTLQKAFTNICHHKSPITTLKELKDVKGVGKWIVTEMRDFFNCDSGPSQEDDDLTKKGKKAKGSKSYLPQKNSVAYALLITLHRVTSNGAEYMRKQDLIDAAEASGLARAPVAPERGRGKPGAPGSSPREFYSGWSAMTKLIKESLVYKSSCPAKYMLSDKGRQVAIECLSRSGMLDSAPNLVSSEETADEQDDDVLELASANSPTHSNVNTKEGTQDDIPAEFLERFTLLDYTREQVVHALGEVSPCWSPKELSTLWPKVLCRLREIEVYDSHSDPQATLRRNSGDASTSCKYDEDQQTLISGKNQNGCTSFGSDVSPVGTVSPLASSSFDYHVKKGSNSDPQPNHDVLRLPPLENLEKFENVYEVVLMLDDRENFVRTKTRNLRENICSEFNINIEVTHLPVGDAIWIARHKHRRIDYVLDFIVERKNVDDLRGSIRDNRYKDQKLRLQRTGIKKIMYVVEGDPNTTEGADSIKTACFTTELLDGFDVQRTSSLSDTLRRYGYLTQAITDYYKLNSCPENFKTAGTCLSYDEFTKKCRDLGKLTVSDVFAMQIMQVPQVTEDVAEAVLNCYPTLYSLACAYANLGEDTVAQEELLKTKSAGAVNAIASRNIFRFVWA